MNNDNKITEEKLDIISSILHEGILSFHCNGGISSKTKDAYHVICSDLIVALRNKEGVQ